MTWSALLSNENFSWVMRPGENLTVTRLHPCGGNSSDKNSCWETAFGCCLNKKLSSAASMDLNETEPKKKKKSAEECIHVPGRYGGYALFLWIVRKVAMQI